ncbi:ATP-binding protein [Bradyrhizobium sp. RT9a]|uniref:ATP-binding protein n=1 Tax=Bradyrhizobium sp. RT9a TaxID=3156384 RepID=UPI003397477B
MARTKKATETPIDRLEAMLVRLQLSGIRDQLDNLLDEAARANLSARETLILLCEREIARKDHRRIEMALKLAHFPAVKELASFDFEAQPSIDPKQIRDLAASRWIANGENVLLLGPPGVGKTHLSIALGREAILAGYTPSERAASSSRPPLTALRSAPPPSVPSAAEPTFNRHHEPEGGGSSA